MLYGTVREWLAGRLLVSQEKITMVVSGRIGFSLSEKTDFGRPFSNESDLDLRL